jgi:hypothetical protein
MTGKTPSYSPSWPRYDEDPSWVPLYQAPFVYRIRSGEDWCEAWDSGILSSQLASRFQHLGVRDAIIDASSGIVTLILSEGASGLMNAPVHFHLAEFTPDAISNAHLQDCISEWVAITSTRLQNWLRLAVEQRCCVIVARPGTVLNGFIVIAPDVFPYFRLTNLRKGEAVNAAGEMLFSLHVAPPDVGTSGRRENEAQPNPNLVERTILDYLRREHADGKPPTLSYEAIAKEFNRKTKLKVSESWVRQTAQKHLDWPRRGKKA